MSFFDFFLFLLADILIQSIGDEKKFILDKFRIFNMGIHKKRVDGKKIKNRIVRLTFQQHKNG